MTDRRPPQDMDMLYRALAIRTLARRGHPIDTVRPEHARFGIPTYATGTPLRDVLDSMDHPELAGIIERIRRPARAVITLRGDSWSAQGDVERLSEALGGELLANDLAIGTGTRREIEAAADHLGIDLAWFVECECHGAPEGECDRFLPPCGGGQDSFGLPTFEDLTQDCGHCNVTPLVRPGFLCEKCCPDIGDDDDF